MTRTGKFITKEELDRVVTAHRCSGMFLSGGTPMGDPQWEVEQLRMQYQQPEGYSLDASNGEFVSP